MSVNSNLLAQLNDQQRAAVEHIEGPLLILAGAGSGKTRTITYKIAYLISEGICRPEEILAVTFTNKAANEMRQRVELLLRELPASPLLCTFHSFGVRILRRQGRHVGYRPDFAICDVDDQKRLFKKLYSDYQIDDEEIPIEKARHVISKAKNKGWGPDEYLTHSRDFDAEIIHKVFSAYQETLKKSNAADFDDLILETVRLLKKKPTLREDMSSRYRYILIDEYQDTNPPQYDLIRQLTCVHENLSAVGDEDQSIYGFRGADISNILRFESDFKGARVIKLEQNYRSTQNILDAATAVVSHNEERKHKVLWTDSPAGDLISVYVGEDARDEALFVANRIRQHLDSGESSIAVLYRTNFQSRQFEEQLRRYSISYNLVGGVSFYKRKEVRDALAYLRAARNPDEDVSMVRILNVPPRGIGQVTRDRLYSIARENGFSLWGAINHCLREQVFPARAHQAIKRFAEIIEESIRALKLPFHIALEKVLDHSGYMTALKEEESEEANSRLLNLKELITVARDFEDSEEGIQEFLDQAALHAEADEVDDTAEVTLMTLHNAKGLEFPFVFLAGCEEGLFPHSRSIAENDLEEERRLCYVGLTRAQKKLYLSYCRRRRFYGRDSDEINQVSRFLHEIPAKLIDDQSWTSLFTPRERHQPSFLGASALRTPTRNKRSNYQGPTYNSTESIQKALAKRNKAHEPDFSSGDIIYHQKYGKGRVLKVESTGDDLKVTVQFPGIGIKKLLQKYAKLRLA